MHILMKYFDLIEITFYSQTIEMGLILLITVLLLKMSYIQLSFLKFRYFRQKLAKMSVQCLKSDYLRNKLRIPLKVILYQRV